MQGLEAHKRQRSQEPVERVELFLGGVAAKYSVFELAAFIRNIAKIGDRPFPGAVQVAVSYGFGRATLIGPNARLAAASALGERHEERRPLAEVKLHNEWYCPCGRSGEKALWHSQSCPQCKQMRPASLLEPLVFSNQSETTDRSLSSTRGGMEGWSNAPSANHQSQRISAMHDPALSVHGARGDSNLALAEVSAHFDRKPPKRMRSREQDEATEAVMWINKRSRMKHSPQHNRNLWCVRCRCH